MNPNFTVLKINSDDFFAVTLAEPSRQTNISYLCTKMPGKKMSGSVAQVRLPNGVYRITYFDPATLNVLRVSELKSDNLGFYMILHCLILLMILLLRLKELLPIPDH